MNRTYMPRDGRAPSRILRAAAPQLALNDSATFDTLFSQFVKDDTSFHDGEGGGKRAAWWRAKILSSSFLVYCRTNVGWSQVQLAQALGVNKSYIAQVESLNTSTKAPLEFLIQAASVTNTPFKIGLPGEPVIPSEQSKREENYERVVKSRTRRQVIRRKR